MHGLLVSSVCCIALGLSALGFRFDSAAVLFALTTGVLILGVPHGGLDHWVGRRLLKPHFGNYWSPLFFGGYLAIAAATAIGWMINPLATASLFFLVSAWHFGLEDEAVRSASGIYRHLDAIFVGGLVIWVPAICRGEEMRGVLESIVPNSLSVSAAQVVQLTQGIACVLMLYWLVSGMFVRFGEVSSDSILRGALFAMVFACCPILVSFGIYFCLWHSLRAVMVLNADSGLRWFDFVRAVTPLTFGASLLIGIVGIGWSQGQTLSVETTRSLFIGLSSIAVPHLILHGIAQSEALCRWADSERDLPDPVPVGTFGISFSGSSPLQRAGATLDQALPRNQRWGD